MNGSALLAQLGVHLSEGLDLECPQVPEIVEVLLGEEATPVQKADFLHALQVKGESVQEVQAFAKAILQHARVVPGWENHEIRKPLLDVCGTGGDGLHLFNVSTTAMFVLAAAGVGVVKHGNRGITSKSGGADVLEALGVAVDAPPESLVDRLHAAGAVFLFAPMYHPAFKGVVEARKLLAERGQKSIFNILGPLLNPLQPEHQLVGVFSEQLGEHYANILSGMEREAFLVVHGKTESGGGVDELSTMGSTRCWGGGGGGGEEEVSAADYGLALSTVGALQGGDASKNALITEAILKGQSTEARRDMVAWNVAGGLKVCGVCEDWGAAVEKAKEVISSGAGYEVLEKMRAS